MKKFLSNKISTVIFFLLTSMIAFAQDSVTITGATTAYEDDIKVYTITQSPGLNVTKSHWSVIGGTIQSQSTLSITIEWDQVGTGYIEYTVLMSNSWDYLYDDHYVSVSVFIPPPSKPNTPIIVNQSTSEVVLGRVGNIPSGQMWYWQGTNSSGTSTSYPATSKYTVTSSGTYYLRAKNLSNASWSTLSSSVQANLLHSGGSPSGLSDRNYVYAIAPQKAVTDLSSVTTNADAIKNITYFDGLGRTEQAIGINLSNSEKDIVTHNTYDIIGRQLKQYLPYPNTTGGGVFESSGLSETNAFYNTATYGNTTNPYSESIVQASPSNRIIEQTAPGNSWNTSGSIDANGHSEGHTIKNVYDSNAAGEVRKYKVSLSSSYVPTLTSSGDYPSGVLYKSIVKDENWESGDGSNHTTEEFKDVKGRVVLKRNYATISGSPEKHDTYYVYDDHGNLTFVLPPKAEPDDATPDATKLSELCYQYQYDYRNRLIRKKIPGKGWESIVYDKLDRPVMTQDANLDGDDMWLFTKYDKLGRVAYTGMYPTVNDRAALQSTFNAKSASQNYEDKVSSGTGVDDSYYENVNFPTVAIEVLTANYYDNYSFERMTAPTSVTTYGEASIAAPKGLATGSRVKVLDVVGDQWITTVNYYDDNARLIHTHIENDYLETKDVFKNDLDFVGKVLETTSLHTKGGTTTTVVETFDYDHAGRLTEQTHKINAEDTEVIVENSYDELGQLIEKGVGGTTLQSRLQTINYAYNVRGWLTKINEDGLSDNDLFNFTIKYDDIATVSKKLYNGNISQTNWNSLSVNSTGNPVSTTYTYTYDALNRINSAIDNTTNYNLTNVDYDKNGNITALERKGHTNVGATTFGVMDDLTYTYESKSNQLKKVLDNENDDYGFVDGVNVSTEYTYDNNGNMITDANKGITNINYNHLNLPTQVTIGGQNIAYIYDATGAKQQKTVGTDSTKYAGNFIYLNSTLQYFSQPEGYVSPDGGSHDYVYQYRDHLDNIRLAYSDVNHGGTITASTEIIEENNYYPFGLKHKGYNSDIGTGGNAYAQKRKFGGNELQNEHDLEWYDITARNYDPALGRWMNIDPLAEEMTRHSPYNYAFNNPVFFIDPDGMSPTTKLLQGKAVTTEEVENSAWGKSGISSSNGGLEENQKEGEEDDDDCCGSTSLAKSYGSWTEKDLAWFDANPEKAKVIQSAAARALLQEWNIAGTNSNNDGYGDAVRHSYWMYLITLKLGPEIAREFGNMHEDALLPDGSNNNQTKRGQMDLINNNWGINFALKTQGNHKMGRGFKYYFNNAVLNKEIRIINRKTIPNIRNKRKSRASLYKNLDQWTGIL